MFPDNNRPLSFPLKTTESPIGSNIPTYEEIIQIAWADIPNDERIDVTINLSLEEYVALATSIDVGRDIAYGEQSELIWWIWQRIWKGASMVNCNDVADCIETSLSVQDAIKIYLTQSPDLSPNNSYTNTFIQRFPDYSTETLKTAPPSCDYDALWAGIREMVERLDETSRDLLEDLAVLNDVAERVQGIIDLVPLLGDIIADVSDFFTETIPDLLNAYDSYNSTALKDEIACDLFCMVVNECRYPTFDEVISYYAAKAVSGIGDFSTLAFGNIWDLVRAVSISLPEAVWYTFNSFQLLTLSFGGTWIGNHGKKTLAIWCSFGEDYANNNWQILCDNCADQSWTVILDFEGDYVPVGNEHVIQDPLSFLVKFSGATWTYSSPDGAHCDGTYNQGSRYNWNFANTPLLWRARYYAKAGIGTQRLSFKHSNGYSSNSNSAASSFAWTPFVPISNNASDHLAATSLQFVDSPLLNLTNVYIKYIQIDGSGTLPVTQ